MPTTVSKNILVSLSAITTRDGYTMFPGPMEYAN